jgi:UDP-N-acetylmuramoyl-tripeptide--D-alanyl-D-alanine ligase
MELGRYKKKLHMEIGEYAKMHGVDLLIGLGDLTRHSVSSFGPNGFFFKVKSDLIKFLKTEISKKDNILLKGSRGMKMEELLRIGKNDD